MPSDINYVVPSFLCTDAFFVNSLTIKFGKLYLTRWKWAYKNEDCSDVKRKSYLPMPSDINSVCPSFICTVTNCGSLFKPCGIFKYDPVSAI